jgi:serine/threonine protein kinase
MIGTVVGNYKIIEALGEGGVGMVYKGVDTMLDREVAIKVLRPELASQTSVVERFRSEAVTLAKLNHPNIATLYSLFRHGDHLFMVLEFIKGETLDHLLFRRGAIPAAEAIPYFCQALEGINYAHERGIVHRDIKPGNMMLAEDGILKVLDFGIARLLGSNRMTRVGNVIGTLEYMSPEQVKGLETDARSDVYGLGIMLYEILTGKLPFESENDFELMKMQTEQMPVLPRQLNPEIPVEVEEAIIKAVSKNPDDRFKSAGDFLETFLELGFGLPNATFGFGAINNFKKFSRPSNPGLRSGETKQEQLEAIVALPQSLVPTEPIINLPASEIPVTLEAGNEVKKENKPLQSAEIKGTRLATPVITNPNEIKGTRLAAIPENNVSTENVQKSASFIEHLTWVHYASAGAVVLLFLSLAGAAVVLPFMLGDGGAKVNQEPKNVGQKTTESKPANVTTMVTPEPTAQPVVKEQPVVQQPLNQEEITEVTPNPTPAITPIPSEPKPVQKQPNERENVKNNPPPASEPKGKEKVKNVPKPTPKSGKDGNKKPNLKDILTGN